jgi:uncharacterized protein YrrD
LSKRATDLIGKPIVSADGGKKLGIVGDLLLDDGGTQVLGFVVRHGMFKGENVLPAAAIQSLGPDAVVSRSNELIGAKEWRQRQAASERTDGRQSGPPSER